MTDPAGTHPQRVFAIYGFEFSRSCVVDNVELSPLFQYPESHARGTDRTSLQLTGYGTFTTPPALGWTEWERVRLLAAGMTFAQQQEVVTSRVVEMSPGDTIQDLMSPGRLGRSIPLLNDRPSFTAGIIADTWSRNSLCQFLNLFVQRFAIEVPNDPLRLAFFRQLEIARLATPFVELHHFLAFSALELLARSQHPQPNHRNAAVPIVALLTLHGFEITQHEIESWCLARNAAFHKGLLVSPDPRGGDDLRLTAQLEGLSQIVCDVLIKMLPFDDGRINWGRWRDRQAFC